MAKYSDIKGFTVQTLSTDTVASQFAGGTWASGGALNTARAAVGSSTSGSQTASLAFGGQASDPALSDNTEQYNGTSWTEVADLNQIRAGLAGVGTTTAAAAAMGDSREIPSAPNVYYTQHEQWDGSSWTETTDVNAGRSFGFSFGTAPAFLVVGGYGTPGFTAKATAEEWNGSGWTEVADLNTARIGLGGAGTTTAGIVAGGPSGQTEQWDGSSWTEVGDFSTGRGAGMCVGTNTAALAFGGSPVPAGRGVLTEEWNGSSWTELNDLSTGRDYFGGSGTTTSALAFGGDPNFKSDTEEWSFPSAPAVQEGQMWIKTATGTSSVMKGYAAQGTGAWSTGGTANTARGYTAGAGKQSSGILIGGSAGPGISDAVETYDGSSWSEITEINTARAYLGASNASAQTSVVAFGGGSPYKNESEEWDGSSWTEGNNLNTAREFIAGFGIQTAALGAGGYGPPPTTTSALNESYNGTSWTEVGDMNTARSQHAAVGTSTAGLLFGGDKHPASPRLSNESEEWDGTAWTEGNNLNTARRRMSNAGFGTQTLAVTSGGYTTALSNTTEQYNGTSWTEIADRSTNRDGGSGIGVGVAGLYAGGQNPKTGVSEEWTIPFVTKTIGTDQT